jgi:hypothetical protein
MQHIVWPIREQRHNWALSKSRKLEIKANNRTRKQKILPPVWLKKSFWTRFESNIGNINHE